MPHDWSKAPEAEWRGFIADHLETLATNQQRLSVILEEYKEESRKKGTNLERRIWALFIAFIISAVGWIWDLIR